MTLIIPLVKKIAKIVILLLGLKGLKSKSLVLVVGIIKWGWIFRMLRSRNNVIANRLTNMSINLSITHKIDNMSDNTKLISNKVKKI